MRPEKPNICVQMRSFAAPLDHIGQNSYLIWGIGIKLLSKQKRALRWPLKHINIKSAARTYKGTSKSWRRETKIDPCEYQYGKPLQTGNWLWELRRSIQIPYFSRKLINLAPAIHTCIWIDVLSDPHTIHPLSQQTESTPKQPRCFKMYSNVISFIC